MCLMPHNKTKVQSGIKCFGFVSCGILGGCTLNSSRTLGHPAVCSQLSHRFLYGGTTAWSWRLVKLALPKDKHRLWRLLWRCLLQGGERGEMKERFWIGYFSWEMNSLIGVFLYQFLNCYPLLLLTFLSFACRCHNVCNVFKVGFLSKKKRNMALKRSLWQKKITTN